MNKKAIIKATGMSILATGMALTSVVPAFAATAGTITINGNANQSLKGKTFAVYKLFNLVKSGDGTTAAYNYTVNSKYASILKEVTGKEKDQDIADYISGLSETNLRTFSDTMRKKIKAAKLTADISKTCTEAEATSATIPVDDMGYYLIDETTAVAGENAAASLVMLQTTEPNATVNIKSNYPSTGVTKKIQEDDGNVGWNDIGDYEIGQTIPYKFTSTVPDMSTYNTYKYIFHDKADACLTLDTTSIVVKIGNATVDSSKYSVVTSGDTLNGDTFQIVFNDLKTATDSIKAGDAITVTYNGVINDNAATKTGRSGFENNVQLEFSNDARDGGESSTGKTPWDTVVCFTYKISGTKINDANETLANAKFHLYTDSTCQTEVKTKLLNGQYVVTHDADATAADIVSDASGNFTIVGIDQGTYYLKETEAPTGYKALENPLKVTITPTFTTDRDSYVAGQGATAETLKSLAATVEGSYKADSLTTDAAAGDIEFSVVNKKGTKLPVTGGVVGTMIMLGAGVAIVAKKRKDSCED